MKTRILISIGDINGIGPEIVLKTLNNRAITGKYDLTVLSPFSVAAWWTKHLKLKLWADDFNIIPVADEKVRITPGKITAESGFTAGAAIAAGAELCMAGEYDVLVTAPISKQALNMGGFKFGGHTEMLTALSGANDSCMFMLGKKINMGFASTHPPIKLVAGLITPALLKSKIGICIESLQNDLGRNKPSIGVLALNPHAGEGGQIGDEEIKIISPALRMLRKKYKNVSISEPQSPDAYFASAAYKKYDMTFAMYHDQGFIPFKMIEGHLGVNFTAGLKFIRTSPDHGTAFDIAGKGIASPVSLVEAIKSADRIHKNRIKAAKK